MIATSGLRWDLDAIAATVGGSAVAEAPIPITSVEIDSRRVTPGSLFVALPGARVDGHDFVEEALAAGAAAVVVRRDAGTTATPRIEVDDTIVALRDLAALRRRELRVRTIAITGSTGKTSTKELVAAIVPGSWASPRSFNNEIGLPLTVLATPDDATALVLEVGSRGVGHIRWLLPAASPDVAVITNIGLVHLETFGTQEDLVAAKWELVEGLADDGVAVLPADERRLLGRYRGHTVTFGAEAGADVRIGDVTLDDAARPRFTLDVGGRRRSVRLRVAGAHQAVNAAAATAAVIASGLAVDLDAIVAGLESAVGERWRMQVHQGRFVVVNDAYNANPTSTESALRSVATMGSGRVAVLGEMAELGPVAEQEHRRIGRLAAELGYRCLVTVGDVHGMDEAAGSIAIPVPDADAAFAVVVDVLAPGDVVLVKASRSVGLERLADRLVEVATT